MRLRVSDEGKCVEDEVSTPLAFRVRDVWIVNNTIDGNARGGIVIDRPADCLMEASPCRIAEDSSGAVIDYSGQTKTPAVRVTGIHILNNLLVGNNSKGSQPCMQMLIGGYEQWWTGREDAIFVVAPKDDASTADIEYPNMQQWVWKGCNETFEIEQNFYVTPNQANNKVVVFGGVQAVLSKLDKMGIETWWVGEKASDTIWITEWANSGYTSLTAPWDWLSDTYDFQADWGVVELLWDLLEPEWNPTSYRLAAGSSTASSTTIAGGAETATGIFDHGVYAKGLEQSPASIDLVDVGAGPDFFYDTGHHEIGAFEVAGIGAVDFPDHPWVTPTGLTNVLLRPDQPIPPNAGIFPDMSPQISTLLRGVLAQTDPKAVRETLWALRHQIIAAAGSQP